MLAQRPGDEETGHTGQTFLTNVPELDLNQISTHAPHKLFGKEEP